MRICAQSYPPESIVSKTDCHCSIFYSMRICAQLSIPSQELDSETFRLGEKKRGNRREDEQEQVAPKTKSIFCVSEMVS